MNISAMEWARAQTSLSILEKSVLMLLASLADDELFVEGQPQHAIAAMANCSRSAANCALKHLAICGRIGVVQVMGEDGRRMPCAYLLNCAEEKMSGRIAAERLLHCRNRRKAA